MFRTWLLFFMNALVIYKYYFGLVLFGMFSTWLIPLSMIGYYVNDCFYFSAFVFFMLPKGERIMYSIGYISFFANLSENIFC